jgi:hypothetical protein
MAVEISLPAALQAQIIAQLEAAFPNEGGTPSRRRSGIIATR